MENKNKQTNELDEDQYTSAHLPPHQKRAFSDKYSGENTQLGKCFNTERTFIGLLFPSSTVLMHKQFA